MKSFAIRRVVIGPQVVLLIFKRSPEALDEHVVSPAAFAIHAQCDFMIVAHQLHERRVCKLSALIGVKDFWSTEVVDRFFNRVDAEVRAQRVEIRHAKTRRVGTCQDHWHRKLA